MTLVHNLNTLLLLQFAYLIWDLFGSMGLSMSMLNQDKSKAAHLLDASTYVLTHCHCAFSLLC